MRVVHSLLSLAILSAVVVGTFAPMQPVEARRLVASASVVRANRYFQQGNYKTAEQIYTNALKRNPSSLAARSGLSMVQAELYKLDAAEKNAQQVLSRSPNNADALTALGKVKWYRTASSDMTYRRQRAKLLSDAESLFRRATQANGRSPEAFNNLGRILQTQGKRGEALTAYDKALTLDPNYEQALVYKGSLLLEEGNAQAAQPLFEKAIRSNSKSAKAHYYKGSALAAKGEFHQALKSLNTALALKPNAPHTLTKMAEIYQAQGNQAGAVSHYKKAIAAKGEYAPAILGLANLLDTRGDAELAVAELRNAINIKPDFTPYQTRLGQLSLQVDKTDQALKAFNHALELEPNNAQAAQGLASTYVRMAERNASKGILSDASDLAEAESRIEQALRVNPDDLGLHLAVLKLRKATEAELNTDELERLVASPASNEVQRMQQAEALLALGRFSEADAIFAEVINNNANNPKKLYQLASALKLQGDTEGAKRAYQAILAQQPSDVIAQRGLNQLGKMEGKAESKLLQARSNNHWYSKKDRMSAKSFYLEALELNPRLSDARLELAKLYERENAFEKAELEYKAYLQLNQNMPLEQREKLQRKVTQMQNKQVNGTNLIDDAKTLL